MNCKDKERIMIVDDDVNVGRSLALIFEKKGYETETAHTGQEALEMVISGQKNDNKTNKSGVNG